MVQSLKVILWGEEAKIYQKNQINSTVSDKGFLCV